jgi:hypothetical protein
VSSSRLGVRLDNREYASPIYEIRIQGLDPKNYLPVDSSNQQAFCSLLGNTDIYDDHPRGNDFRENIRRMLPAYSKHAASREWFEGSN